MPTSDEIENDQYHRINDLTEKVGELSGAVEVSNVINGELVKLLRRQQNGAFLLILILILALLYATIGAEGYKAVRETLAHIPKNGIVYTPICAPPDNRVALLMHRIVVC